MAQPKNLEIKDLTFCTETFDVLDGGFQSIQFSAQIKTDAATLVKLDTSVNVKSGVSYSAAIGLAGGAAAAASINGKAFADIQVGISTTP